MLFDDVLLGDGVESREAAAFTFAREESRPLQREVFSLRELAGVLDVVPDAVNHAPEFEFDPFGVGHRVQAAAVFQPPVFAAVLGWVEIVGILQFGDVALRVLDGEIRRRVFHRAACVLHIEKDAVSQQFAVFLFVGGESFAVLLFLLGAHAERCPGEVAQRAVARTVGEQISFDRVFRAVLGIDGCETADRAGVVLLDLVDHRVEQQRNVGFGEHFIHQHHVEQYGVTLLVAKGVFNEDLVQYAAFTRPTVVVAHMGGGAQNPQAHLARSVASEYGPVLDQDDLDAGPRCGDGAAYARHAPSGDYVVGPERDVAECPLFFEIASKHSWIKISFCCMNKP